MRTIAIAELKAHLSAEVKKAHMVEGTGPLGRERSLDRLARGEGGIVVAYLDPSLVLRYILAGDPSIRHAAAFPRMISSELLECSYPDVLLKTNSWSTIGANQ